MVEPPVLFLYGPTASGKTALAMRLVDALGVEIVSVDSAMVYRQMDIGTAKPTAEELQRYPHRLINLIDPTDSYSAARFCADAEVAVAEIHAAGRLPLLVGGTMLYFRALERGLAPLPEADPETRRALEAEAAQRGWAVLHRELAQVDPEAAARIHPHDPQRLQRALEVYRLTGEPLTQLQRQGARPAPWPLLKMALLPAERKVLHERIGERFERMLAAGFVDEVARLRGRGDLTPDCPAMRAVGYRQVWRYLDGGCSRKVMVADGKTVTRRLAKRQMTWIRSEQDARIIEPGDEKMVTSLLNDLAAMRI